MCRGLVAGCLWLSCSIAFASESNTISPGMDLVSAKAIAQKYDYEYGEKHVLAMAAVDDEHALEFVRIDLATTLVISYLTATSEISSPQIEVIPDYAPKLHRRHVSLNVLAISISEDGIYTIKLKRTATSVAEPK